MEELRCENRLWGRLLKKGAGVLEVKCSSRFCGASAGVVVFHRFDLSDAHLIETRRYRSAEVTKTKGGK